MIPRLEAEESNLAAERVAIGTGAAGTKGRDVTARWERQAAGDTSTPAPRPVLFSREALARMPIRRVAVVKRKPHGE